MFNGQCSYAFTKAGINLQGSAEEIAEQIRQTTVAAELAAALDYWAEDERSIPASAAHWRRVALLADPDERRRPLREVLASGEDKKLLQLIQSEEVFQFQPVSLITFSRILCRVGSGERGIALLRAARKRYLGDFWINMELGKALAELDRHAEAVRFLTVAVAIRPQNGAPHLYLGMSLDKEGLQDETNAEFREASRFQSDNSNAHNNFGCFLHDRGYLDAAIAEFRKALSYNDSRVLIKACAHSNLGNALKDKGQLEEAVAEYREAIRILKNSPQAREAREGLRQVEQMAGVKDRLSCILEGKDQSKDAAERLGYALLCQQPYKQHYVAAVRLYREAFAEEPKRADDLDAQHRYSAACAAALAGCGQGKDADNLDAKERARLRQQALDWLRADLKAYRQAMEKSAGKTDSMIAQRMQHWLQDNDFAGVRGDKALATLPEEERSAWRQLWTDVAEMLAQAQGKASAEKKADTK